MAELIRKDALVEELRDMVYNRQDADELYCEVKNMVYMMPTTIEAEIRAKALKYAQTRFRNTYETMVANKMENCINWADMLDSMVAEQLKEE